MMSARNSGKRIVVLAVAATATAVGVGTIWAPFYADRDKLRGLHEESDLSGSERQQYEAYVRQLQQQQKKQQGRSDGEDQRNSPRGSNNMWSRMDRASSSDQK